MIINNVFLALFSVCLIVLVILWLQSGFDKVFNFKDNESWLKGHFAKSILKGQVKSMLICLTIIELSAGFCALVAIIDLWFLQLWYWPLAASFLSMLALSMLFFGQRMAKDYAGAAGLVGYMIYSILMMFVAYFVYSISKSA